MTSKKTFLYCRKYGLKYNSWTSHQNWVWHDMIKHGNTCTEKVHCKLKVNLSNQWFKDCIEYVHQKTIYSQESFVNFPNNHKSHSWAKTCQTLIFRAVNEGLMLSHSIFYSQCIHTHSRLCCPIVSIKNWWQLYCLWW